MPFIILACWMLWRLLGIGFALLLIGKKMSINHYEYVYHEPLMDNTNLAAGHKMMRLGIRIGNTYHLFSVPKSDVITLVYPDGNECTKSDYDAS